MVRLLISDGSWLVLRVAENATLALPERTEMPSEEVMAPSADGLESHTTRHLPSSTMGSVSFCTTPAGLPAGRRKRRAASVAARQEEPPAGSASAPRRHHSRRAGISLQGPPLAAESRGGGGRATGGVSRALPLGFGGQEVRRRLGWSGKTGAWPSGPPVLLVFSKAASQGGWRRAAAATCRSKREESVRRRTTRTTPCAQHAPPASCQTGEATRGARGRGPERRLLDSLPTWAAARFASSLRSRRRSGRGSECRPPPNKGASRFLCTSCPRHKRSPGDLLRTPSWQSETHGTSVAFKPE